MLPVMNSNEGLILAMKLGLVEDGVVIVVIATGLDSKTSDLYLQSLMLSMSSLSTK